MSTSNDLRNALKEARFPAPIQPIQTVKAALIPVNSELHDYLDLTFDTDAVAALVSGSIDTRITAVSGSIDTRITAVSSSIDTRITAVSGSISSSINLTISVPGTYANDAGAASAGVRIGGLYHTTGTVKVRLT